MPAVSLHEYLKGKKKKPLGIVGLGSLSSGPNSIWAHGPCRGGLLPRTSDRWPRQGGTAEKLPCPRHSRVSMGRLTS